MWANRLRVCFVVGAVLFSLASCIRSVADSKSECAGPGRYEVGKANRYLPCCAGLHEFQGALPSHMSLTGQAPFTRVCSTTMPLNVYVCVKGMCGDGICERGEALPCGCVEDCPSAAWGPRDQEPFANELLTDGSTADALPE